MNMFQLMKDILAGKTMLRSLMNAVVHEYEVSGMVVDIGGGVKPDYHSFFKNHTHASFTSVDLKEKAGVRIDLEKDPLPYDDKSVDVVLMFNILEHIYNHLFLVKESYRILKPQSRLIGFVPFLINYHPDPHDYFRYTREALEKIFQTAGYKNITIIEVGRGPFTVNYNNIVLSIPKFMRIMILPLFYSLDSLMLKIRPGVKKRYPLGYMFEAHK